jgi:hypothetical protein
MKGKTINSKIISISMMALLVSAFSTMLYLDENGQLQNAEAAITISGRVTTNQGAGVANAKVYFEAPATSGGSTSLPVKAFATTDSQGYYSITTLPSGETYTVDATKYNYERKRYASTITTTSTNVNFIIYTQAIKTLNMFIAADEEFRNAYPSGWQSTAWSKLSSQQSVYKDNWNVNFWDQYYSSAWNSPSGATITTLLSDGAQDTGWSGGQYQNSDVLALISGQDAATYDGWGDIPSVGGNHPRFIVDNGPNPSGAAIHEIFHNYGFAHHTDPWYCIMQVGSYADFSTAMPNNDSLMALSGTSSNRYWY